MIYLYFPLPKRYKFRLNRQDVPDVVDVKSYYLGIIPQKLHGIEKIWKGAFLAPP